jgi:hypothetical protein
MFCLRVGAVSLCTDLFSFRFQNRATLRCSVQSMQEVDFENECKVIVVGNGQVGKTSMITRFAKGVFTNSYKKTVGTDFMEREMFLRNSGESIKLLLVISLLLLVCYSHPDESLLCVCVYSGTLPVRKCFLSSLVNTIAALAPSSLPFLLQIVIHSWL